MYFDKNDLDTKTENGKQISQPSTHKTISNCLKILKCLH